MAEVIRTIDEMIEEVQRSILGQDRVGYALLTAKRDALCELKFRVRDGIRNECWVRRSGSSG